MNLGNLEDDEFIIPQILELGDLHRNGGDHPCDPAKLLPGLKWHTAKELVAGAGLGCEFGLHFPPGPRKGHGLPCSSNSDFQNQNKTLP
jgi:hypothetical protein